MSNQLIASCEDTFKEMLELLKKKNSDYAGDADSYKNFIDPEMQAFFDKHKLNMDAVQLGIRVRMKDKFARLNTLLFSGKDPAVVEESFEDTLNDIIGYASIWKAWRQYNRSINGDINKLSKHIDLYEVSKHNDMCFQSSRTPVYATAYKKQWNDECICGHLRSEHSEDPSWLACNFETCNCTKFNFLEIENKEI